MPPIGFRPITERYSFARRPLVQGGVRPRRAWLSVNWMAASSPAVLRSGGPLGMKRASALTARTVASHCFQSSVSRAFRHSRNWRRSGSRLSVVRGSSAPVASL